MTRRRRIDRARAKQIYDTLAEASNPLLADIVERNIGIIEVLRRKAYDSRTVQDKFADAITAFSGSMAFLYLHAVLFFVWIVVNLGWVPGVPKFDAYPFELLTMSVSLEAIFLSTFVLISQNRQGAVNEQREALDLQIDLLAEYEITRMLRLVDKIAEKLGIEDAYDKEIDQLCEPVAPEVILKEIELRQRQHG